MNEQHISQIKDFLLKHCEREAKRLGVPLNKNIQVRFEINPNPQPQSHKDLVKYATCKKYQFLEDTDFSKICNFVMGLDMLGYGKNIEPLIRMALDNLCYKYKLEPNELYVFANPDEDFEYDIVTEDNEIKKSKEKMSLIIQEKKTWKIIEVVSLQTFVMENVFEVIERTQNGGAQPVAQ